MSAGAGKQQENGGNRKTDRAEQAAEHAGERPSSSLVLGILAPVDAGKTTLSEALLYRSGSIRKLGRVDHRDTFLDTDVQERERGITIFAKQAVFPLKTAAGTLEIHLLDTPGHTDFSAEMERSLSVLDYAILVVSAPDSPEGYVQTLWKLLRRYDVPTFLFVNKMDQPGMEQTAVFDRLRRALGDTLVDCTDFAAPTFAGGSEGALQSFYEACAELDEQLLDAYLSGAALTDEMLAGAVGRRSFVPCLFGSALAAAEGSVDRLLAVMGRLVQQKYYPETFGARVFKLSRDGKGERLAQLKILGGKLQAKALVQGLSEKADQIRRYSGTGYQLLQEAEAGMIVSVTGLSGARAGMGLGAAKDAELPLLLPLYSYDIELPEDINRQQAYQQLRSLAEEIPELSVRQETEGGSIKMSLMGEVQLGVIQRLCSERFGFAPVFGAEQPVYRETPAAAAEGVGHFEPLRHYAEVHLLVAPGERGSGLVVDSDCSEDVLAGNYQQLILKVLSTERLVGVLTGSELTDAHITLLSGRAHPKHTEGGDFREAALRALRNGLMRAGCRLLAPYQSYSLHIPQANLGRAMTDLQQRGAQVGAPELGGDGMAMLCGRAPAAALRGYQTEVTAYTKGSGRLHLRFDSYDACPDSDSVAAALGYDPEADTAHPVGSVFCAHGAGFYVPWNEVVDYMHLPYTASAGSMVQVGGAAGRDFGGAVDSGAENGTPLNGNLRQNAGVSQAAGALQERERRQAETRAEGKGSADYLGAGYARDRELEEIFQRTFGKSSVERRGAKGAAGASMRPANEAAVPGWKRKRTEVKEGGKPKQRFETSGTADGGTDPRRPFVSVPDPKRSYLLVDGYNIIFAWEELRALARLNLDSARSALMDVLSNYQGYQGMTLILVFDAYRVRGGQGEVQKYHNLYVVYTKEAETADQYIEKTVHDMEKKHRVTVATSDGLEQVIVFGEGAVRMSAQELYEAVQQANQDMREQFLQRGKRLENRMQLPQE